LKQLVATDNLLPHIVATHRASKRRTTKSLVVRRCRRPPSSFDLFEGVATMQTRFFPNHTPANVISLLASAWMQECTGKRAFAVV
jgi:hypothetical protein